jgi:SAM-dependent methyltransferase
MNEEFAAGYGDLEQWHWWFRGRARILQNVLRRCVPERVRSVLSVGCGPAEGLRWLLPFTTDTVVGLDMELLHARHRPERIRFAIGALPHSPLADETFELVLALDVLEHLDDDAAGLADLARLVKPGGVLLITVPALPSLWGGQDVISHHRRRYTKRSFSTLFERAGISTPRIAYFNTILFPFAAAVRWGRRAAGHANRPRSDFEDNAPGIVNDILARAFAAERHLVGWFPFPVGVSLLATWRRPGGANSTSEAS